MNNAFDELNQFISDRRINIPDKNWDTLNNKYEKQELIDAFKKQILSGNIELPTKKIDIKEAEQSFLDLIDYNCNDLKTGNIVTRYDYEFKDKVSKIGYKYIDETNVGNVASNYFHQNSRYICGSINSPSPVRTWKNEKFLNGMLNAMWTLKCKAINDNAFRTCLALRKYVASQFKPSVAKSIYEKFNSVDVLDFCAGWGDRFCGFYACKDTRKYIGIDPNTNTYSGYLEQEKFYSNYVDGKESTFICDATEDIFLESEIVDTVFTSPPYFNVEKYSDDEKQSFKRYRKLDDWLNSFLFKAIDISYNALKKDGYLIINISDVYSGHRINHICDPMNYYIQSLGMKYEGMIGMKMAKRPNSRAFKEGIFVEPIWIWRK